MKSIKMDGGTLLCPECGGSYLHQDKVTTRIRDAEDGPGEKVELGPHLQAKFTHLEAGSAEFLGRRDDLTVEFRCETCSTKSLLVIRQHKGETLLYYEPAVRLP